MRTTPRPEGTPQRPADEPWAAFTFIELLTVIAVIGMLAATLLPALARPRGGGPSQTCLDNTRRLVQAWLLYSADDSSYVPPNPDDGNPYAYHAWLNIGEANAFNPDILNDPSHSLLAPYLKGDVTVYRCPSDPRTGLYQGTNVALQGQVIPAACSYAMNVAIGTDPYDAGGKRPTGGPWLDGIHCHTANQTWFTFARTTDMRNPGPAKTFVFLDEDYRSILSCVFPLVGPHNPNPDYYYEMINWPGTYHDYGANFAFADGHSEFHKWQDPRTQVHDFAVIQTQLGNLDIPWMSEHATALVRQPQLVAGGLTAPNTFNVVFSALKGTNYVLEYKDSVSGTNWTALPAVSATNSGTLRLSDPSATNAQRFYRAWTL